MFEGSAFFTFQYKKGGHSWLLGKASLIAKVDNYKDRRICEAIEILRDPNNINRDVGLELKSSWAPRLRFFLTNVPLHGWQQVNRA